MKAKEIIKLAANVVTGLGVGKTVDLVLKNNLPVNMDWKGRVATFIGSAALSGYISAKCSDYVEDEVDKISTLIENAKIAKNLNAGSQEELDIKIKEED